MKALDGVGELDHVGIVVTSLEQELPFWCDTLGYEATEPVTLGKQGVRALFLESGPTRVELIEPIAKDTGVARFLESREGRATLHHVCVAVRDGEKALADLRGRGYQLIDTVLREGADGMVAFLHPSAADGVLVELVVRPG